jgi:hypothetical protein
MTGQALWALGELQIKELAGRMKGFLGDQREIWFYENDSVSRKHIGTIAEEALKKMGIE